MLFDLPCEIAVAVDEHFEDILDDPVFWMNKLNLSQSEIISLMVVGKESKRKVEVFEDENCDFEC